MGELPIYKGYTVDYRLKQFRLVHPGDCVCGGGEIEFIDFDSEKGRALLEAMSDDKNVPIYTPVLRATGERLRIEHPIFEEGFRRGRGLHKKGIICDPRSGKRYQITGKPCDIPNCQCDAWAVEVEGDGTDAQEPGSSPSLN